jgi:1-acyl-sn-glycerol-3-phosphate acyltransferase
MVIAPDSGAPSSARRRAPDLSVIHGLIGRLYYKIFGWKVESHVPDVPKAVLIAAPHTSNWDLTHMLGGTWTMRVRVRWFGKKAIFRPPFGGLMRALGGISINRGGRHNVVDQLIDALDKADRMILTVPAAGTRSRQEYWKSGFYHIAVGANVPIVLGYLDYAQRRAGISGPIYPTGDVKADMDKIRKFYATRKPQGKFPEKVSRIRLEIEDQP